MAVKPFAVPNSILITPTGANEIVSVVKGYTSQSADFQQWQNAAGSPVARVLSDGSISGVNATLSGDIAVNGGDVTSSATTFNLLNTTVTTLNLAGAGTAVNIGASTGSTTVNNSLIVKGNTTLGDNVGDTITVSGTPTFKQVATFENDIAVNGGDITTTAATFNFVTGASTVNIGQLAGTIDLKGSVNVGSGLVVQGNLTVNGTTTTVNSTTISVDDKNIELGSVGTPTDTTADGGGITLKGSTDKTIIWDNANDNWTSSEHWNLATGKVFKINNVEVLSSTTLGSSVVSSSLAKVGTIATGVWQGSSISTTYTDAKVVSVTSGVTATVSVGGTTANPTVDLATVSQSTGSSFVKITLDSYGRVTGNTNVSAADITGVLGYTPANSGSVLSGAGSANKIAYWSDSTSLTYDSDMTYDSTNNILAIGNNNINGSASGVNYGTGSNPMDSFSATTYRSAKYIVQATYSTQYQVSEILVIHDGSTAYITEYGLMYTGASPLVTFGADILTGNIRLLGTVANNPTTIRFTRTTINS